MTKSLSDLLNSFENQIVKQDGKTLLNNDEALKLAQNAKIENLVFDSREVKENSLFFALPGIHTTGNKFIHQAIQKGASVIVFQDDFSSEEIKNINDAILQSNNSPVFVKVNSSRFSMSPISRDFYDNPSSKLIVYGVTGTEGKSSTVSFIWQLLQNCNIKAGFISTVQYSLGDEAINNPQHQTTPEAPIVQRQLYEMLQNGCTHAVVESSSHGLSEKTNRLGDVLFDCGLFMNVTLEHLEFHGTYEQYKSDKANLFRALDKSPSKKIINGKECTIPKIGIVNLEDPAAKYFSEATNQKVIGFTSFGKAGKFAEQSQEQNTLPELIKGIEYFQIQNISNSKYELSFEITDKNQTYKVKTKTPGAFNSYNICASIIAVHNTTGIPVETLCKAVEDFTAVKGRMTVIDKNQNFEVIVDYAHTPSSFETIFPPIRKRCKGKMICIFGSGGERDIKKRPLQGKIAAQYCDIVILTDEDPRGEDSMELLEMIAKGSREEGKKDNIDLFFTPDRKKAIRQAFSFAQENDIVLLLGKSHENSIIYKDYILDYDEISEAEKALEEMGY